MVTHTCRFFGVSLMTHSSKIHILPLFPLINRLVNSRMKLVSLENDQYRELFIEEAKVYSIT